MPLYPLRPNLMSGRDAHADGSADGGLPQNSLPLFTRKAGLSDSLRYAI